MDARTRYFINRQTISQNHEDMIKDFERQQAKLKEEKDAVRYFFSRHTIIKVFPIVISDLLDRSIKRSIINFKIFTRQIHYYFLIVARRTS